MASIVLPGSIDVVLGVSEEFYPMGNPSCNSGDGEEDREHIGRETHSSVNKSTVEIDVGVKLACDAESNKCYKYSSESAIFSSSIAISMRGSFPQISKTSKAI